MFNIPDYFFEEEIYRSNRTVIYRGYHTKKKKPLIIKLINSDYPESDEIFNLKREYHLLNNIEDKMIISVYDIIETSKNVAIAFVDIKGKALSEIYIERISDYDEFLSLSIMICEAIQRVHSYGIIHKDITLSNIVYNENKKQLQIIDFGISNNQEYEKKNRIVYGSLEGTLLYTSPEQTGRLNRIVDYRTDYYSLGVLLYKLIIGFFPFKGESTLEMVYNHITQNPLEPHIREPRIPYMISKIIMKLLEKNPEDRYQNSHAIINDLKICKELMKKTGRINEFKLASNNIPEKFIIPQKMYGRSQDILEMKNFLKKSNDQPSVILLSGPSGIGKTSFVYEALNNPTNVNSYFVSGKYEKNFNDVPYYAFREIIKSLINQAISSDKDTYNAIKTYLNDFLSDNTSIMHEFVPEIEFILGKQNIDINFDADEIKNRLMVAIKQFLRVFTLFNKKLIVFLDDIQWMDLPSLQIFEHLIYNTKSSSLVLIVAFRNDGIKINLPVKKKIEFLRENYTSLIYKELKGLSVNDLKIFLKDAFNLSKQEIDILVIIIMEKSGNNPFYINQFLKKLIEEKHLIYDILLGSWNFSFRKNEFFFLMPNVASLLSMDFDNLSFQIKRVLSLAACIGSTFTANVISLVLGIDELEIENQLQVAKNKNYISASTYQIDRPGKKSMIQWEYHFTHDNILESIYSKIDDNEKIFYYKKLASLYTNFDKELEIYKKVKFYKKIINHISKKESKKLLVLLSKAGKQAKDSGAYTQYYEYYKDSYDLIKNHSLEDEIDKNFFTDILIRTSESAFLNGNFTLMNTILDEYLLSVETLKDRLPAFELRIQFYIAEDNLIAAKDLAIDILNNVGITIPRKNSLMRTILALLKLEFLLLYSGNRNFQNLKPTSDPLVKGVVKIISKVGIAMYLADPDIMGVIVSAILRISIKKGITPETPFALIGYSIVVSSYYKNLIRTRRLTKNAINMFSLFESKKERPRTLLTYYNCIDFWFQNPRSNLDFFLENYRLSLEVGDIEYASMSLEARIFFSIITGVTCEDILNEMEEFEPIITGYKQKTAFRFYSINKYFLNALTIFNDNPINFIDKKIIDNLHQIATSDKSALNTLGNIHFFELYLSILFRDFKTAIKKAIDFKVYFQNVLGTILVPLSNIYISLSYLGNYHEFSFIDKFKSLKKVKKNQKDLKKWISSGANHFEHFYYLIKAEIARVLKNKNSAELYEKSYHHAIHNGFYHDAALISEFCAEFYKENKLDRLYLFYLKEALFYYKKWGAQAKVIQIQKSLRNIILTEKPDATMTQNLFSSVPSVRSTEFKKLDEATIIKTSRIISSEIVLDLFIERMMLAVMENAGARRGLLFLEKDGELYIEAEIIHGNEIISLLESIPLSEVQAAHFPISIINHIEQSHKSIIIDDTTNNNDYLNDQFFLNRNTMSLLCIPLMYQGKMNGILYLENDLTKYAFPKEQQNMLVLLSAQIAISIENARIYSSLEELNQNLEKKVNDRTMELNETYSQLNHAYVKLMEKEKIIQNDLNLAKQIQLNILPDISSIKDINIHIKFIPMVEIGGDIYDIYKVGENVYRIFLADATGHGIQAALVTMLIKSTYDKLKDSAKNPGELLFKLNNEFIEKYNILKSFFSCLVMDLDLRKNTILYSSAGHLRQVLYNKGKFDFLHSKGKLIGIFKNMEYKISFYSFDESTKIFLYTDGIIEELNSENEMFDEKRVFDIISSVKDTSKIMSALIEKLSLFCGNDSFSDDITILGIDFKK